MTFNLASILKDAARRDPQHPAIVTEDETISYGELERRSDAVAAALLEAGLQPGGAVALQLPNIPEFAVSLHGILKAGGVIIPMNTLYKAGEISYALGDAHARHMITVDSSAGEASAALTEAGGGTLYVVGDIPAGVPGRPFAELVGHEVPDPVPFVPREPGDTAILLYTSGTTGKPKGVQLTHFQLFMNAAAHVDAFEMDSSSKVIAVMPLFHALGLSGILNATVRSGGTVLLMSKFDTEKVLENIRDNGATINHGVPTMDHSLLNFPGVSSYDTSSLKMCGSAGAAIPALTVSPSLLSGHGAFPSPSTRIVEQKPFPSIRTASHPARCRSPERRPSRTTASVHASRYSLPSAMRSTVMQACSPSPRSTVNQTSSSCVSCELRREATDRMRPCSRRWACHATMFCSLFRVMQTALPSFSTHQT